MKTGAYWGGIVVDQSVQPCSLISCFLRMALRRRIWYSRLRAADREAAASL